MWGIPDVTAKDCQDMQRKYRELLDYFGEKIDEALPR